MKIKNEQHTQGQSKANVNNCDRAASNIEKRVNE